MPQTSDGDPPKQPLVSVVIPSKNRARFLKETIESILSQDYPNIECIVVDGGSSDDTVDILKSYGKKIRWYQEADRGAFDAINKGWRLSQGQILAWLNADDSWEKGAVSLVVEYFNSHPGVDVVYGACGGINVQGVLIEEYPARRWNLTAALEYCDHIVNQAASFMRREIVEKAGYLYPAWCHDHDLWLRIALAEGTFAPIPVRLANARIWPDNLGNNPDVVIPAKINLTRRFFETPGLPSELMKLKQRSLSNAHMRGLYYLSPTKPGNWPSAGMLFWRAVSADPSNTPYLTREVAFQVVRRLPVVYPSIRLGAAGLRRGVRVSLEAMRRLRRAARSIVGTGRRRLTPPAPLLAISVGIATAIAANPSSLERAAVVFFYASTPLLAMVFLYEFRRRG